MSTRLSSSGRITIPKRIRDALGMQPGTPVDFVVSDAGLVVLVPTGKRHLANSDRFAAARGTATVKWRTDELMALLRG